MWRTLIGTQMTPKKTMPLLFSMAMLSLTGCRPDQWDLGAPEVLQISDYVLNTTPAEGTARHKVEEVWVYSETDVVGVYPLPATVTLPGGEPQTLTLVPGIRANGIAATRRTYPFYEVNRVDLDGEPTTEIDHVFEGNYVNTQALQTKVILAEDFESANRFLESTNSNVEVQRIIDSENVFEGDGSGYIRLDSNHTQLNAATHEQFYDLPRDRPVYLEFHYKCDVGFVVGLEVFGGSQAGRLPILVLNPNCNDEGCDWNKIYLDLYPALSSMPDAGSFEIGLNANIPADGTEGNIWIDNFKFVHFDD
ncbi:MAG TPA: hypothetical protein DCS71_02285 [Flavobacteriales bacterium]|nr:hypothetical protein [Flavobacteriales bacterium]